MPSSDHRALLSIHRAFAFYVSDAVTEGCQWVLLELYEIVTIRQRRLFLKDRLLRQLQERLKLRTP